MVARAIAWVLVLCLFWAGLSGYLKPLLVGSGVLSIAFSWWFVRRARVEFDDWSVGRMVMAGVTYLPWLLWQVLLSNLRVIKIVWSPNLPIAPQLVEVPCTLATPTGQALFANSITMTPGTVTLSEGKSAAGGKTLLIHALTAEDAAGVLDGSMHARVAALEPASSTPAHSPAPVQPKPEPAPESPTPEASETPEADAPAASETPSETPAGTEKAEASEPTAEPGEAAEDSPKESSEGGAS